MIFFLQFFFSTSLFFWFARSMALYFFSFSPGAALILAVAKPSSTAGSLMFRNYPFPCPPYVDSFISECSSFGAVTFLISLQSPPPSNPFFSVPPSILTPLCYDFLPPLFPAVAKIPIRNTIFQALLYLSSLPYNRALVNTLVFLFFLRSRLTPF